jgi:DNA-binding transcriptional LysR family regulator
VHRTSGERETITFLPSLAMNDFAGLVPALVAGVGIGMLPPIVQPGLLRDARLVEVMPAWRFPAADLSLVHLGNRLMPPPVRLFKDFAAQKAAELFPKLPT